MHCLAHPEGEKATSRAAAKKNIPMGLSTYSTVSLEDVRREGGDNPYAFQLSIVKDRNMTLSWIKRAEGTLCSIFFLPIPLGIPSIDHRSAISRGISRPLHHRRRPRAGRPAQREIRQEDGTARPPVAAESDGPLGHGGEPERPERRQSAVVSFRRPRRQ